MPHKKRCVKRPVVAQPLHKSYRLIPLTQNQFAIVDVEDFEHLSQWNWYAKWNENGKTFYAARSVHYRGVYVPKILFLHQVILPCRQGQEVDHINHNTLDNRRENLRRCTRSQNIRNQGPRSHNRSGFKGVCLHTDGKFQAALWVSGKQKHLGLFDNPVDAARAYDKAVQQHYGGLGVNFAK